MAHNFKEKKPKKPKNEKNRNKTCSFSHLYNMSVKSSNIKIEEIKEELLESTPKYNEKLGNNLKDYKFK